MTADWQLRTTLLLQLAIKYNVYRAESYGNIVISQKRQLKNVLYPSPIVGDLFGFSCNCVI